MASKKQKEFYIEARIIVDTNILVKAESLEDALTKSKEMDMGDFLDLYGDNNESSIQIRGVFSKYESLPSDK